MKKTFFLFTCLFGAILTVTASSYEEGGIDDVVQGTEDLWKNGSGSEDSSNSAVSLSMLGWGIGAAAAIAILASAIHQSD